MNLSPIRGNGSSPGTGTTHQLMPKIQNLNTTGLLCQCPTFCKDPIDVYQQVGHERIEG